MKKFIRGLTREEICHYVLLSISVYFCYTMYSDMLLGLLAACLVFEVLKPITATLGVENWKKNKLKSLGFFAITGTFIFLSLNAICSDMTNNYFNTIAEGTKQIQTTEWNNQDELKKTTKAEVDRLTKEIGVYPTLDKYISGIPSSHSTNRAKLTSQWQDGKNKLNSDLDKSNIKYKAALDGYKGLKQFKTTDTDKKYKSYTKYFNIIGKKIGVNPDFLFIGISLIIACLIELLIMVTKRMAVIARQKKLGTYQSSFYERLEEYQQNILENNFKSLLDNKIFATSTLSATVKEIEPEGNQLPAPEIKQLPRVSLEKDGLTAKNNNSISDNTTAGKQTLERGKSEFYPDEKADTSTPLPAKNKIGFTPDTEKQIDEETEINLKPDIMRYLEYMFKYIKDDNYSPGKRDIKTATGLQYRTIDLIWEQLEKVNIIKVEEVKGVKKSKILKSKDDAMKLINKYF